MKFYPCIHASTFTSTGQAFLHEQAAPGTYVGRIKVDAEPDPSCNPARQQCERWEAGNYTVKLGNLYHLYQLKHEISRDVKYDMKYLAKARGLSPRTGGQPII